MATVRLSLDAWKAGHVRPAEYEVQVVAPRRGPKPEPVSRRLTRTLIHTDRGALIRSVFFAPDGKWVAGAGFPWGGVQVWDPASGRQLHHVPLAEGYLDLANPLPPPVDGRTLYLPVKWERSVRVANKGGLAMREEVDGEVQVWDLPTGRRLPALRHSPPRGVRAVAVSPDGARLAALECRPAGQGIQDVLTLWDVRARTSRDLAVGSGYFRFSPDGKTLAAGRHPNYRNWRGALVLWDVARGKRRAVLQEAKVYYGTPAFSPDGRYLAVTVEALNEKPEVRLWEVATGKQVGSFAAPETGMLLNHPAFSPDGRRLAATVHEGRLFLYDVPAGKRLRVHDLGKNAGLGDPVFSPDGRWLAVPGQPQPEGARNLLNENPLGLPQARVFLFDLASGGKPEVIVAPHGVVGRAAFSRDGRTLALGGSGCVWLFRMRQAAGGK